MPKGAVSVMIPVAEAQDVCCVTDPVGVAGSELTVIVILLDVAVVDDAQLALLVITQEITSVLATVFAVYEVLLVPTLLPFFFH